jgi:hypothetical protein
LTDEFEKLCIQARKCRWLALHLAPDDAERLLVLAKDYERRASDLVRAHAVEE